MREIELFILLKTTLRIIELFFMRNYLISGLIDEKYRIKVNLFAISPDHALKIYKKKYPKAKDIYVIQDLFKSK